jgi:hypothetical protein
LGVLVQQDLCQKVLVGEVVFPQVEMCWRCQGHARQGQRQTMDGNNIPTCPAMLKPAGMSPWRSSGKIEAITSPVNKSDF